MGPTLGLVVGQMWTVYLPRARACSSAIGLPLSELCQWGKLGLALLASLVALAAHARARMSCAADGARGHVAALAVFALVYVIAARIILREEYGYMMRAFTRRRKAA